MLKESAAGVGLREREGRLEVLLVRSRQGNWIFPKGKKKNGEHGLDAAMRETIEESGWEAANGFFGSLGSIPAESGEMLQAYRLCGLVQKSDGEPGRQPSWFPVNEARELFELEHEDEKAAALIGVLDAALQQIGLTSEEGGGE